MTEPTTEELVYRLKARKVDVDDGPDSRGGYFSHKEPDPLCQLAAQRLSDLEGKLGEARKALAEIASEDFGGPGGISIYAAAANELSRRQKLASEALKLTASGGGEDNSLSQGAADAASSGRPDGLLSAGGERPS